jgi:ubiquinone/menaquinone biosynthesis C-methylase UbiE
MLNSKFWKNYFKVYDVLNLLIPYQELLKTICDELDIEKGEKILEAGCGTGNLDLKISEKGGAVIGLDNCKEALEIYQKKDRNAKVVLADLTEKLPFPDNFFDKIACNNTLYTIPKEKQLDVLKEFYRILKPNGKIIIVNPKKGAKILPIYFSHIEKSFKKIGVRETLSNLIKLLSKTIKMIYFNSLIKNETKREIYKFLTLIERKDLLQKAGFSKSLEPKFIYANQNILNVGIKQ